MKSKRVLLVIVIAIAMMGAVFYLLTRSMPSGSVHEVVLTEDGFKPDELTIEKGDAVEFSSSRGKPFWPASNVHPTHEEYSDFDPQEPIAADQKWSFTFFEEGEFEYHDHLAAFYTGVIVVE